MHAIGPDRWGRALGPTLLAFATLANACSENESSGSSDSGGASGKAGAGGGVGGALGAGATAGSGAGTASGGAGGSVGGAGGDAGFGGASGSAGSAGGSSCGSVIEGYGAVAVGGDGGDVFRVTSLDDSGPGTLRDGVESRAGPRAITFDIAGTITLASTLRIDAPFLTVDGCEAPAPGITLTAASPDMALVGIEGTHDIILRHLRIVGLWQPGSVHVEGAGNLYIDGDANPDHVARAIAIDHVTLEGGNDSAFDVWGEVADVTLSYCLLHDNQRGGLISHYPAPFQTRQRLSYHHNVYARNIERNPQIRADVRDFDFVNNVLYEWGFGGPSSGYGIRIRGEASEPDVEGNFISNFFVSSIRPDWALVYGTDPGPDADEAPGVPAPAQGTVIASTTLGRLWVADNRLPPQNLDQYSTVAAALPVPALARVTTQSAAELRSSLLPLVGTGHRNPGEQALLDDIAAAMAAAP